MVLSVSGEDEEVLAGCKTKTDAATLLNTSRQWIPSAIPNISVRQLRDDDKLGVTERGKMLLPGCAAKKSKATRKRAANKTFEQRLEDLRAYKKKHGHVNVKQSEDKSLYAFCYHMKQARKKPDESTTVIGLH